MKKQLYTWDKLYERADGAACGSQELNAKDNARWELGEVIKRITDIDIETCESAEAEIDWFLNEMDTEYLFDEDGNLVEER